MESALREVWNLHSSEVSVRLPKGANFKTQTSLIPYAGAVIVHAPEESVDTLAHSQNDQTAIQTNPTTDEHYA